MLARPSETSEAAVQVRPKATEPSARRYCHFFLTSQGARPDENLPSLGDGAVNAMLPSGRMQSVVLASATVASPSENSQAPEKIGFTTMAPVVSTYPHFAPTRTAARPSAKSLA